MTQYINTGGPVFPVTQVTGMRSIERNGLWEAEPITTTYSGMSLRDWFATHCPAEWVANNTPKSIGGMRDALIARGLIPASRKHGDPINSYTDADARKLTICLRWEYADAMLAAREAKTEGGEA